MSGPSVAIISTLGMLPFYKHVSDFLYIARNIYANTTRVAFLKPGAYIRAHVRNRDAYIVGR